MNVSKKNTAGKKRNYPYVFLLVVVITLAVGESFPFSYYPMYNHFPNWSYTFYLADDKGHILSKKDIGISYGSVSHVFFNECQKRHVEYGDGMESGKDLSKVGKNVIKTVIGNRKLSGKRFHLYRINNYFLDNQIHSDTSKIATLDVEK